MGAFVALSNEALATELDAIERDASRLLSGVALRSAAKLVADQAPGEVIELDVMDQGFEPVVITYRALRALQDDVAVSELTREQVFAVHEFTHSFAEKLITAAMFYGEPSLDEYSQEARLQARAVIAVHNAIGVPNGASHVSVMTDGLAWLTPEREMTTQDWEAMIASILDMDDAGDLDDDTDWDESESWEADYFASDDDDDYWA